MESRCCSGPSMRWTFGLKRSPAPRRNLARDQPPRPISSGFFSGLRTFLESTNALTSTYCRLVRLPGALSGICRRAVLAFRSVTVSELRSAKQPRGRLGETERRMNVTLTYEAHGLFPIHRCTSGNTALPCAETFDDAVHARARHVHCVVCTMTCKTTYDAATARSTINDRPKLGATIPVAWSPPSAALMHSAGCTSFEPSKPSFLVLGPGIGLVASRHARPPHRRSSCRSGLETIRLLRERGQAMEARSASSATNVSERHRHHGPKDRPFSA